jgi:inner membrane protein
LLRVASIGLLMALLLIPLSMISGIVSERQRLQRQVEDAVSSSFAGTQRLVGPMLVIPYVEREIVSGTDEKGRETKRTIEHQRQISIVPEQLEYDATADVEAKHKGIYKALVYQTKVTMRARFDVPANLGLYVSPELVSVGNARLAVGLSDLRGLRSSPRIKWAGRELSVSNGAKLDGLGDGLHGTIGAIDAHSARQYEVTLGMDLGGMRSLAVAPIGKSTVVQLRSAWAAPKFWRAVPAAFKADRRERVQRALGSFLSCKQEQRFAHARAEGPCLA